MSREAMKQALDALIDAARLMDDEGYSVAFQEETITALRQALEQQTRPATREEKIVRPGVYEVPVEQQPTGDEPMAHCEAGPNYCQQCQKESLPTYGSEEVRKLREVIESQAQIIEANKPPPWFAAVDNILKEYGLQAIDFVADFKAAMKDAEQQPAAREPLTLDEYDAGLLGDYGGGDVEWWQDYIRAELGRAYEHYQAQAAAPQQKEAP